MIKGANIIFIFIIFIILPTYLCSDELKYEITAAIQKSISTKIKLNIPTILQKIVRDVSLTRISAGRAGGGSRQDLNSTIITEALNNLKDIIPEKTSMIPFAIAEPISSNILFYFGILNSSFVNLTLFHPEASVNNTATDTSISVNVHLNSSSLEGHYELDICSYDLHLYGDGNYSAIIKDIDYKFITKINIFQDNSFQMTDFLANITIGITYLTLTNLLNGDTAAEPLLNLTSEIIPAEVGLLNEVIQATMNSSVVDLVNNDLATLFSWNDIVWMIGTFAGH